MRTARVLVFSDLALRRVAALLVVGLLVAMTAAARCAALCEFTKLHAGPTTDCMGLSDSATVHHADAASEESASTCTLALICQLALAIALGTSATLALLVAIQICARSLWKARFTSVTYLPANRPPIGWAGLPA